MAIAQILLMYEYIDLYAPIDKCKAVVKQIKKVNQFLGSVEVRRVKKRRYTHLPSKLVC